MTDGRAQGGSGGNAVDLTKWRDQAEKLVDSPALATRIPGVDARDPWSQESLKAAESEFLRRFGTGVEVGAMTHRDYQQFLGEGLVKTFGGEWVKLSGDLLGNPEFGEAHAIRYHDVEHLDVTDSMLEISLEERTGRHWADLFKTNAMCRAD